MSVLYPNFYSANTSLPSQNGLTALWNGASSGTLTLPAASGCSGYWLHVKNLVSYTLTIAPTGTDPIEGVNAAITLPRQWSALDFVCNGTQWYIL